MVAGVQVPDVQHATVVLAVDVQHGIVDRHGNLHSPTTGRFIPKHLGIGNLSVRDLLNGPTDWKATATNLFEGTFDGLTTKVADTGGRSDRERWARGTILDRDGATVGEWDVSINPGGDSVTAWIDNIALSPDRQGSGFTRAFHDHLAEQFRRLGVDELRVAAEDVGGYTWASLGYDFDDHESADAVFDNLRNVVEAAESGMLQGIHGVTDFRKQVKAAKQLLDRANNAEFVSPDFPTARELSQLGRRPGQGRRDMWLGKYVMLGSNWTGVLPLSGGR